MHKKTYTTVVSRGKITSYLNFTFCNVIHFRHYYLHIIRRKQIGSKLEQQKRPSETDEVWPLQQLCSTKVSIYRQWNGTHSLRRARGHGCVCMSLPPCTAAVCGRPSGHLLPRLHGQLGMASSKTCSYRDTPHRSPPTPCQLVRLAHCCSSKGPEEIPAPASPLWPRLVLTECHGFQHTLPHHRKTLLPSPAPLPPAAPASLCLF